MRIHVFGTYDTGRHPRVAVLKDGLQASGDEVAECNVKLGMDTVARIELARRPWLVPIFAVRLALAWAALWRQARQVSTPDVVVIGYLGHLDVHLARRLFKGVPLALDYLVSLSDTAEDRNVGSRPVRRFLRWIDARALDSADLVIVDTDEHREALPDAVRHKACVVPVGAPGAWFVDPPEPSSPPLRVVFFGLYTPLQGAPVIGEAIAKLADDERISFTMIGDGQDAERTREAARVNPRATWIDWVDAGDLPRVVAEHHVCLGIFGASPKARRVTPNKVFQGAAAGCAIVTSDTPPQRRTLGDDALYVPPGEPGALAEMLRMLADDPEFLAGMRARARRRAMDRFRPEMVVEPLRRQLEASVRP